MCGIAGFVGGDGDPRARLAEVEALQRHRGPDLQAVWHAESEGRSIGLAFQRLSIIDLSEAGAQPMAGRDGESRLVFNGEIYNYLELRERLVAEGCSFRGGSDTEVLLAALERWGVERALDAFNGMWALAWFDPRRKRLILARDRTGIKPLYTWWSDDELVFASEIKGVLALARRRFPLDLGTVRAYLEQALLDVDDGTFFAGVGQVAAGSYLEVDLASGPLWPRRVRTWRAPVEGPEPSDRAALEEEVRETFLDAVRLRLRSDVPVGVLLSGGIDSTAIACAAHHLGGKGAELALLSAVSSDPRHDESPYVDAVGAWLGREPTKVPLDLAPDEAFDLLERVTWNNDEPVGSFTSVAHYKLMEEARSRGVTVVLSGQGADELLCGYKKYPMLHLQRLVRRGSILSALADGWAYRRRGTVLAQFNLAEARRYLPRRFREDGQVLGAALAEGAPIPLGFATGETMQERQRRDLERLSVPQLLHYEDRMSMAFGREIRLPFLDHRLIELLLPLATSWKLNDGWTKHVFRRALAPLMPPEISWRRDKQGFSLPQDAWIAGPLRPRILDLFEPDAHIFRLGLVDRERLLDRYQRFSESVPGRSGVWYREILHPLALEIWLRTFGGSIEGVDA